MQSVRNPAPYMFLNPSDDGEETDYYVPVAEQKREKKVTEVAQNLTQAKTNQNQKDHKKSQHGEATKPVTNQTIKQRPKNNKQENDKGPVKVTIKKIQENDEPLPESREQNRQSSYANKLKDRPPRSKGPNNATRHAGFIRKDSLKKEIVNKNSWGHPIDSQKEDGTTEENDQNQGENNRPPRRPRRNDRFLNPLRQNKQQSNDPEQNKSADNEQQRNPQDDRPPRRQPKQPVENKAVQFTLEEYIANKTTTPSDNNEGEEPTKKSKGLYVASDDSDWVGIPIPKSDSNEKKPIVDKKKGSPPKNKSQKILFSFDEKQPPSFSQDSHNNSRNSRPRNNQRDSRPLHHREAQKGTAPTPDVVQDESPLSKPQQPSDAPPPLSEEESKKKFIIDFPALA